MAKRSLYENFIDRIDRSVASGHFFEASWYIYAVLEDRLISLLANSGGAVGSNGAEIRMLGPKLSELRSRSATDQLLNVNLPYSEIDDWRKQRNNLMHAMAEGTMEISQIDTEAKALAEGGQELVRAVSAGAMRVKKHRNKV